MTIDDLRKLIKQYKQALSRDRFEDPLYRELYQIKHNYLKKEAHEEIPVNVLAILYQVIIAFKVERKQDASVAENHFVDQVNQIHNHLGNALIALQQNGFSVKDNMHELLKYYFSLPPKLQTHENLEKIAKTLASKNFNDRTGLFVFRELLPNKLKTQANFDFFEENKLTPTDFRIFNSLPPVFQTQSFLEVFFQVYKKNNENTAISNYDFLKLPSLLQVAQVWKRYLELSSRENFKLRSITEAVLKLPKHCQTISHLDVLLNATENHNLNLFVEGFATLPSRLQTSNVLAAIVSTNCVNIKEIVSCFESFPEAKKNRELLNTLLDSPLETNWQSTLEIYFNLPPEFQSLEYLRVIINSDKNRDWNNLHKIFLKLPALCQTPMIYDALACKSLDMNIETIIDHYQTPHRDSLSPKKLLDLLDNPCNLSETSIDDKALHGQGWVLDSMKSLGFAVGSEEGVCLGRSCSMRDEFAMNGIKGAKPYLQDSKTIYSLYQQSFESVIGPQIELYQKPYFSLSEKEAVQVAFLHPGLKYKFEIKNSELGKPFNPIRKNTIYVELVGDFLNYDMLNPSGEWVSAKIDIAALGHPIKQPLDINDLQCCFPNILKMTSQRCHSVPFANLSGVITNENNLQQTICNHFANKLDVVLTEKLRIIKEFSLLHAKDLFPHVKKMNSEISKINAGEYNYLQKIEKIEDILSGIRSNPQLAAILEKKLKVAIANIEPSYLDLLNQTKAIFFRIEAYQNMSQHKQDLLNTDGAINQLSKLYQGYFPENSLPAVQDTLAAFNLVAHRELETAGLCEAQFVDEYPEIKKYILTLLDSINDLNRPISLVLTYPGHALFVGYDPIEKVFIVDNPGFPLEIVSLADENWIAKITNLLSGLFILSTSASISPLNDQDRNAFENFITTWTTKLKSIAVPISQRFNQNTTTAAILNSPLLMLAIKVEDIATLNEIFKNLSLEKRRELAQELLVFSTQINKKFVVSFLLSQGADPTLVHEDMGQSACVFAENNHLNDMLELFKQQASAPSSKNFSDNPAVFFPNIRETKKSTSAGVTASNKNNKGVR